MPLPQRDLIKQSLSYFFVVGLLIFLICILAYTPTPAWMQGPPGESAVGVPHAFNTSSLKSSAGKKLQLASVPLNAGQIKAIVQVCNIDPHPSSQRLSRLVSLICRSTQKFSFFTSLNVCSVHLCLCKPIKSLVNAFPILFSFALECHPSAGFPRCDRTLQPLSILSIWDFPCQKIASEACLDPLLSESLSLSNYCCLLMKTWALLCTCVPAGSVSIFLAGEY